MKLADVSPETEVTFLHCLHDERRDDPRVMEMRRRWFHAQRDHGLRGKVLVLDTGEVAGLCQYMPIERTFMVGSALLAILCIWVHGYEHLVGNVQGNGYGRYMLESIERDARESGKLGVSAWGMDFPHWNPVSFYEHMGYTRADKSGMAVLVWKPFSESAVAPRFLRPVRRPVGRPDKVSLAVFVNGWCMGSCEQSVLAREAVDGLECFVDYMELDGSDPDVQRSWGISDGVYLQGEPYRPHEPPWTSEVLRRDLLDRIEIEGGGGRG